MSTIEAGQEVKGLVEYLGEIKDPRVNRQRCHLLVDILVMGVCCLICGGEGFNDMETFGKTHYQWLKTFLALPGGIPSHDTFNRVFRAIRPERFVECFVRWTESLRAALDCEIVSIDGKALRRARNSEGSIAYIVSAWASKNGMTLGQLKVDEKSNEITAIPRLLQILDLSGCIVTIDAMGCQKQIAADIIEADAHYVLALKGNQATAEAEIRAAFDQWVPPNAQLAPISHQLPDFDTLTSIDGDHGRVETRRYSISSNIDWFEDKHKWCNLRSVGMVESIREIQGVCSYERRLFLCSIEADASIFANACRSHWGVENPLHWVMDVVFAEDSSRARTDHAPENMATLRRMALNLIKSEKSQSKLSIRRKRLMAGWDTRYLEKILNI
jgi:predicted transposase YbfD/YdcC